MLSELHGWSPIGQQGHCQGLSVLSIGHFDLEGLDLIITKIYSEQQNSCSFFKKYFPQVLALQTMNRFADAPSIVVTHSRQLMKA